MRFGTFHKLLFVLYVRCSTTVLAQSTETATVREHDVMTGESRLPSSDVADLTMRVAELSYQLQNIAERLDVTRAECRSKVSEASAVQQEQVWTRNFNELTAVVDVVRSTIEAAVPSLDEHLQQLTTTFDEMSANHSLQQASTSSRLIQLEATVDRMSTERVVADGSWNEKIREASAACDRRIDSMTSTLNASLETTHQKCSSIADEFSEATTRLNGTVADLSTSVQHNQTVFAESIAQHSRSLSDSLAEIRAQFSQNQTTLTLGLSSLSAQTVALGVKIGNKTANLESQFDVLVNAIGDLNVTQQREASHWNTRLEALLGKLNSSNESLTSAIFMTNESCSRSVSRAMAGIETLSTSLLQKETSLSDRVQRLTAGLQDVHSSTSSLSALLSQKVTNFTSGLRHLTVTVNSLTTGVEQVDSRCTSNHRDITSSIAGVSTSLTQKEAAWNNRFNDLSTSNRDISATLNRKEAAINIRLQQLVDSMNSVTSSLTQKEAALNTRIQQLTSGLQTVQSQTGALSSRSIKRCRVCFREIEGSSQCQQNRNTCSGWSDAAGWTLPFRDDTDRRGGGCTYQWMVECQA